MIKILKKKKYFLEISPSLKLEDPIRDEIFSPERLEQYALYLSSEISISTTKKRGRSLLPRLEENYECLVNAYNKLTHSVEKGFAVSSAGEWFIDNFHIIKDQVREVREDLPEAYYRELPKIQKGDLAGYPQVYVMALALVAHQDSYIDIETVKRFLNKYQTVKPLLIGEVWAIAIALRLVLIENLRRLANQIVHFQEVQEWADYCADQVLSAAKISDLEIQEIKNELIKELEKAETSDSFIIVQLSKRLREQSSKVLPISDCLDHHLASQNLIFENVLHAEYQRQAASQVTVSNIVNSMRLLSNIEWQDFFENVNLIDPILDQDPAEAYQVMDFKSRDRYRHVIERIQKKTGASETDIANYALSMAKDAFLEKLPDTQRYHVGYYIIGNGLLKLEEKFNFAVSILEQLKRIILKHPITFYFSVLISMIFILLTPMLMYLNILDAPLYIFIIFVLVAVVPISDSCLNLLNLLVTRLIKPRVLPKIDLSKSTTIHENAFVVVPTILSDINAASKALDGLEVRFLSNQEDNLFFALLSDFVDSSTENNSGDNELLDYLTSGINDLNLKYSHESKKFFLFHRKRLWNPYEHKWMGWERKRGKIQEFNQYLRGSAGTSFIIAPPFDEFLSKINYVITLDSDTQLPRSSAIKLLGTILHPLNKPHFDAKSGFVVRGYGILQPRISITLESSQQSLFAKIFSGHTGIDPYTTAVSDIYQDLFGEGIYTGKGLYHLDSFESALAARVPENTLLSHDLFEGLFVRTALVTEVEFLDDYPSKYEAFSKRQHRWTRGDWQILQWLFFKVPNIDKIKVLNQLPFISRWKIFDNLRRSFVSISIFCWLVFSLTLLPEPVGTWPVVLLFVLAIPFYAHAAFNLLTIPRGTPWLSHVLNIWAEIRINSIRFFMFLICIPHQAYLQVDAISRTLFRVFISKKNLLNWQTAADVETKLKSQSRSSNQIVLAPILIALFLYIILFEFYPKSLIFASPLLISWIMFPIIIKRLSQTIFNKRNILLPSESNQLRHIARKTWNFFEKFVTKEDNWLPPDNFQEDPKPLIAHRTSPTNMGLLLLSTCSAYNFGYIGSLELIDRLQKSLLSMLKLEKCFGHFYNWYDTQSLQALNPKYISTVDSGNLAGHLIAVKQCCESIRNDSILSTNCIFGMIDTLKIVEEKINKLEVDLLFLNEGQKDNLLSEIRICLEAYDLESNLSLSGYVEYFNNLNFKLENLKSIVTSITGKESKLSFQNLDVWMNHSLRMCQSYISQIKKLTPEINVEVLSQITQFFEGQNAILYSSWQRLTASIDSNKSLEEQKKLFENILSLIEQARLLGLADDLSTQYEASIGQVLNTTNQMIEEISKVAVSCDELISNMNFKILFNSQRKLFSIGFNVELGVLDNSFYDLLASESRLTSFIAIAKGDVPQSHWFHLGRQLTSVYKKRVLVSWSASMFEYLMPLIVMRSYVNTILNETEIAVIKQQMVYCKMIGVPWGISESAYNARDLQMNYQYGPFGIPGIGLKRGLSNDTVVSPYSTALAAMVLSHEAVKNFEKLIEENILTDFGFYESIDYTKGRVQPGQNLALVRNFMVHHQGMILTSLDNVLNNNILQNHFHNDLLVRSSELLLQERAPNRVNISRPKQEEDHIVKTEEIDSYPNLRQIELVKNAHPVTQVLSNGRYTVTLTASGSGFSKRGSVSLSRWKEDRIDHLLGHYVFLEDISSRISWSASFAPLNKQAKDYKTIFSEHKAEFWCHKNEIASHTEVIVTSGDDVEMRRLTLINHSNVERTLNITSYLEPILTSQQADMAHKTFSNLFIETEYLQSKNALIAHRRKRSEKEQDSWGIHLVTFGLDNDKEVEYETSRDNFIGRANDISHPQILKSGNSLSNTVGAVLDPAFSLRKQVTLSPHATVRLCFVTGLTHSREEALILIDRYHDQHSFEREDEMGWTQSQAELRHLNINFDEAKSFQKLGASLLFPCSPMRALISKQEINYRTQSSIWAYGISGDLPILLVNIKSQHEINIVRQLLHAHEYFRYKGFNYDMIIMNSESSSYRQELHDELLHQVRMAGQHNLLNKDGGIFVIKRESIAAEDFTLLRSIARVYINAENGNLKEQLARLKLNEQHSKETYLKNIISIIKRKNIPLMIPKRQFENSFGGFSEDGKEYIILLEANNQAPAPWSNIVANQKGFGFLVSERGSSYTWSKNSRENRISHWSNDPVCDPSGECIYIVDIESGEKWSATPAPIKAPEAYLVRHGQGYTQFENNNFEIQQKLLMFCSIDKEVKINQLSLKNNSAYPRKLSLVYYVELVLGTDRSKTAPHIITAHREKENILYARNPYSEEFGSRVTFMSASEEISSFTGDRLGFLGASGKCQNPEALNYELLDDKVGFALDPCMAIQIKIELAPNEEKTLSFFLGQESSEELIEPILTNLTKEKQTEFELNSVKDFWNNFLNKLQIHSPYPEFDILINRWLPYQNLVCRIWARSAFYQSGGAFGFRDQLQDVLALIHNAPQIARDQIILAASCQFIEGDVLHWWHPPSKKGVRTHFSDDLLWLPFTVATYVKVLGDYDLLETEVSFLEGPELPIEKEDLYFQPKVSDLKASIYEHCVRAIDRSLGLGDHGLPFIGTGDWNDGMNQIGAKGKGESVWMAWFLISTLNSFINICENKKDVQRIAKYKAHIKLLSNSLETIAWDGNWYKRAFFDDGQPLGSKENDECVIDSLTQSWAALSGMAQTEHLKKAMDSVTEYLVNEDDQLVLLFAPPFDKTELNPGYIKGYLPGVRENGGQYTHAAVWAAMGFAAINDGEQAFNILSILNPINHARTRDQVFKYKVEPYVIAADVYFNPASVGRGGWTWYTGSAGWYYRALTESIFGIYREGKFLRIDPCLPEKIANYEVEYRYESSLYVIRIKKITNEKKEIHSILIDGKESAIKKIPLLDDNNTHYVEIILS